MRHLVIPASLALWFTLMVAVLGSPSAGADQHGPHGRYWNVSYNSALEMHEIAAPLDVYPMGAVLKVSYHGRQVRVHVMSSCQCVDISDEAMDRLADTGQGVIRARVERVRR